jgi:uncharacterized membrane protein YqgA involved in biofilm formation
MGIGVAFSALPVFIYQEIRAANLIPAIFIPWVYLALEKLF